MDMTACDVPVEATEAQEGPDIDPAAVAAYEAAVLAAQVAGIDTEAGSPKQLRDALSRSKAEVEASRADNERLRQAALATAFDAYNLDPERGLGRAVALTFEGTAAELPAFMESEFDMIAPLNPMAGIIANEQARLDAASQGAGSVPVANTQAEALAEAEAVGHYRTAMDLKSRQMTGWFRPG